MFYVARRLAVIGFCIVSFIPIQCGANADGKGGDVNPSYASECGSCHIPYPARLLNVESWNLIMNDLAHHFKIDASIDEASIGPIKKYLEQNARKKASNAYNGEIPTRITETHWFTHEHDEISELVWQKAKSKANCEACHTRAQQGRFSEREIKLPSSK